jgi:hypothetical protein
MRTFGGSRQTYAFCVSQITVQGKFVRDYQKFWIPRRFVQQSTNLAIYSLKAFYLLT